MDNKWMEQQTEELIRKMDRYREECRNYPEIYKMVNWNLFDNAQYQLENVLIQIENGN